MPVKGVYAKFYS